MISADIRPDLEPYYTQELDPKNLAPLCEVLPGIAKKSPKTNFRPIISHYKS